jgi:hypothetical protein
MPCKIASFLRPKTDMWYGRPHSFLENFIDTSGYIGRRAFYQNQWARDAEGIWVELNEARFTGDDIAQRDYRVDYSGGLKERASFKERGFYNDKVNLNTTHRRFKNNLPPVIDLTLWENK